MFEDSKTFNVEKASGAERGIVRLVCTGIPILGVFRDNTTGL